MTVALLTGAQDLAETRATLNQLIEEFNAAIAAGGGGVTFPLTAPDNAIAINGSDATSGFGFDADGLPELINGTDVLSASLLPDAADSNTIPGLVVTGAPGSTDGFVGIVVKPSVGLFGAGSVELDGFHEDWPVVSLTTSDGPAGTPTAVANNTTIGEYNFFGRDQGDSLVNVVQVRARMTDNTAWGGDYFISTQSGGSAAIRFWIDGSGNVRQANGVMVLDTAGDSGGIAIGSLPGSPTLGMMAVVNDALAPAVGVQVAAMGGAKAAVWWNGTQWTVWGI